MHINPACPICKNVTWEVLGTRRHARSEMPTLSEYARKRYQVLFDIWLPGATDVEIHSGMCSNCGFVSNLPRPEESDIDAKYRYLHELGQDYGSQEAQEIEAKRSQALYAALRRSLPRKGTILDFGGGDGRLMQAFADRDYRCLLIDYNSSPRSCVEKIADTAEGIPAHLAVDGIVCSHVIEHVADPVGTMHRLGRHLKPSGVMFVEVPMEIWRKAPLQEEPVTHINFFTPRSLKHALQEAELAVKYCRLAVYLHPSGRFYPAVRALGQRFGKTRKIKGGPEEVRRFLAPSFTARFKRRLSLRPSPFDLVPRILKRLVRKIQEHR